MVDANIGRWVKEVGERVLSIRRLDIGPRLTLCFVLIIFAMLVGNAVLLWQFGKAEVFAQRLSGVDQELIAAQQAHISLMSSYERLGDLAQSQDSSRLLREVEGLRDAHLEASRRSRFALTHLPLEVQPDPTLLLTLVAIQDALPAQLDAIIVLAKANQWDAVRLRLTNQVRPLEARSATLVENIDRTVSEARGQAVWNIRQVQRRILFIVPITAGITFLFAALLGLTIMHSITQPLGRLIEGSSALANGDFSHRVPASGKDEIARLGGVFNHMIVRLQQLYCEVQRRESYLSQAQRLSHTGSFGWNVSNGEIYWSQETFRIFGYEPTTKITVDLILERIHPRDRLAVQELIERVSRERQEFDIEHRLLMPNGSIKHLRVVGRPSSNEEGRFEFVGAVTDVTERRTAEEALRESESYLSAAQRLSRTGSFAVDLSSGKIYWSEETYRIFECDPATEPTVEFVIQRTHPADRKLVQESIERASTDGSEMDHEHRLQMPDGSVKHLRVVGHSKKEEWGEPKFVGAVTDITERKRAEEALYEAQEREFNLRLEERLAERERIARELHDTLLQSVQGLILKFEAVAKQIPKEEAGHQAIEKILDHADAVLAEASDRVRNLRATPVSLRDLPAAFQEVAEKTSKGSEATFKTAVEGTVRKLHPIVLEECFAIGREALVNAFAHSGGLRIEVEIAYDPRQFRLRIRDDGRGIDPRILENGGGSDQWGLQGMRERANRIGGQLHLSSHPDSGTEVELRIPAATAYRSPRRQTDSPHLLR
jgi:PAS domain S-box-containing protein